jgi:hypothetical protein
MTCNLCHGSGALLVSTREFWGCPKCGGGGASLTGLAGPEIRLVRKQSKFLRRAA